MTTGDLRVEWTLDQWRTLDKVPERGRLVLGLWGDQILPCFLGRFDGLWYYASPLITPLLPPDAWHPLNNDVRDLPLYHFDKVK